VVITADRWRPVTSKWRDMANRRWDGRLHCAGGKTLKTTWKFVLRRSCSCCCSCHVTSSTERSVARTHEALLNSRIPAVVQKHNIPAPHEYFIEISQPSEGSVQLWASCLHPFAQWSVTVWTANKSGSHHVMVLGRVFTHRCGALANSASHSSGVSKWVAASAGKAEAGMVYS